MNVLVIAPHPDDEVLGCGGTILKHFKKKDNVYLCMVTKRSFPEWSKEFIENKRKEVLTASNFLGIKKIFFLDFPTVRLDTVPQKDLNDAIFKVVNVVKPGIAYIPNMSDLNKDHRLVFEASLVALRSVNCASIKRILSYETLSSTEWGGSLGVFDPTVYVDISETVNDKKEAMNIYKSEVKKFPHPRSIDMITVLAKKRGSEVGIKYAEAFMLIKEIVY